MEDKELQELFDAKRTVEANRRRQEALRQKLEATTEQRKTRPLWPLWAGAAAAAVALLLLTLPALFGSKETTPTLIAETEVPEIRVVEEPSPANQPCPARKNRKTREAAPVVRHEEEVLPEATPTLPEPVIEEVPVIEEEPTIEKAVRPMETVAPTPRVMRRQSTLIACTDGCAAPEGIQETPANNNVKVNFLPNDNYADATIYSIPIKK